MQESQFTLYHYWRSSCSWRVRWALELKELSYSLKAINLLEDEQKKEGYLKINPSGQVPSLQVGDKIFTESLAIIEWLDERYPKNKLVFGDPENKIKIRELSYKVASGIQPIQNLSVMKTHSKEEKKQKDWSRFWIEKGFEVCEILLKKTSTSFCVGNQISLADLCLIPQVYNALRFELNLRKFPTIERIYHNALQTKECKASHPEQFSPKK